MAGPAPLQLAALLRQGGGQQVAEQAIYLAVYRHLGQGGLQVDVLLHRVVALAPGVAGDT